jgi:hypothetical protein
MIHLNTYNTSYGRKKGQESKCQFDSWSLKVKNRPKLGARRWRVAYHWKAFDEGYNFASNLTSIEGLQKTFIGIQSDKNLNFKNFKIPDLGVLGKMTFECSPHGQSQRII